MDYTRVKVRPKKNKEKRFTYVLMSILIFKKKVGKDTD